MIEITKDSLCCTGILECIIWLIILQNITPWHIIKNEINVLGIAYNGILNKIFSYKQGCVNKGWNMTYDTRKK